MQLRASCTSPVCAGIADHLALRHAVAATDDDDAFGMGIGGDIAIVMPDQDEIAVALQLVAGIGDDAGGGGMDRRARAAAILMPSLRSPVSDRAEGRNDAAVDRPDEASSGSPGRVGRACSRASARGARRGIAGAT